MTRFLIAAFPTLSELAKNSTRSHTRAVFAGKTSLRVRCADRSYEYIWTWSGAPFCELHNQQLNRNNNMLHKKMSVVSRHSSHQRFPKGSDIWHEQIGLAVMDTVACACSVQVCVGVSSRTPLRWALAAQARRKRASGIVFQPASGIKFWGKAILVYMS